jgi:hypothetical protein
MEGRKIQYRNDNSMEKNAVGRMKGEKCTKVIKERKKQGEGLRHE